MFYHLRYSSHCGLTDFPLSLPPCRKVNTSEHIVRKGALPESLVKEVSGQVAFEEEGNRILPLTQFPDNTINLASAQLVNNHKNAFLDERIYAQVGYFNEWIDR